ncbi:MAG: retroviral-like aspartic protease family protein [Deltaproteobacteria bacterium]|nr:retroviral-like aspartic protease family protein [Deltaproteobacteria bacterium]
MGEIRVKVQLENSDDLRELKRAKISKKKVRRATVEALVDTGAVMMLLPEDLVDKLGLEVTDKAVVALANEEKVELDVAGSVALTIGDRKWTTDCLVGPPTCEAIIGQLVLERLDLIIDPLKWTVTPRPESPFLPLLKLK